MTIPQQPPKRSVGPQVFGDIRLKWRLLRDKRVSGWLKLAFASAIPWIIFPDLIPGFLDDALLVGFLIQFEQFCPGWVVQELRAELAREDRGEASKKPRVQPVQRPTPTQTSPPPPVKTVVTEPTTHTVVIHHTNDGKTSVFSFTQAIVALIAKNRNLRHKLQRLGNLSEANLLTGKEKEGEAITTLADNIVGLRVVYTKKKR